MVPMFYGEGMGASVAIENKEEKKEQKYKLVPADDDILLAHRFDTIITGAQLMELVPRKAKTRHSYEYRQRALRQAGLLQKFADVKRVNGVLRLDPSGHTLT